jgi:hypothetical protein
LFAITGIDFQRTDVEKRASLELASGNENHSIGSGHERKAVKAQEWWAWALPIEFIELSESIAYGY